MLPMITFPTPGNCDSSTFASLCRSFACLCAPLIFDEALCSSSICVWLGFLVLVQQLAEITITVAASVITNSSTLSPDAQNVNVNRITFAHTITTNTMAVHQRASKTHEKRRVMAVSEKSKQRKRLPPHRVCVGFGCE